MCGIAGVVGLEEEEARGYVSKMNDLQAHRGPDANGIVSDQYACLGHRRLAIIDLDQRSNQPLISKNGRFWLVFNGEIYNYREIRLKLIPYKFRTESDSEILLAGYEKWGEEVLQYLNGMFSFAIWDTERQSLFVARDRLGIKPLYYSTKKGFSFSSELRAIIHAGVMRPLLNMQSLKTFLINQSIPTPETLIDGVQQLPAGCYGVYREGKFSIQKYWSLEGIKTTDLEEGADLDALKPHLLDAVSERTVADVDLGAFLSGGIDSSAIVGLLSELKLQKVNTFSIGFKEDQYDESSFARLVSKKFETNHENLILTPEDLLSKIPDTLQAMDSPTADGVNTYIISEAVRNRGIKVALSGLGGDELFAGYPVFKQLPAVGRQLIYRLPSLCRQPLAFLLKQMIPSHRGAKLQSLLSVSGSDLNSLYPIFRSIATAKEVDQLFLVEEPENAQSNLTHFKHLDTIASISALELSSYTENVLLRDTDQMSMAHGLEVRVPFLDHRLVEKVLATPGSLKFGPSPKHLLIQTLGNLLPTEIVHRKKQGFALPWEHWLKHELKGFAQNELNKLSNYDLFNQVEVERLWWEFQSGNRRIHWSRIWTLVILGNWIRTHLD